MENRTQPRNEKDGKPVKRESRLGFRSIFARRRGVSEVDELRGARNVATPESRDSFPTDSGSPFGLHLTGMQSETHIAPFSADGPVRPWTAAMRSPTFAPPKSPLGTSHKKRGSLATWDPVPLFQAFPQAIRIATLPACAQADSLLRVHYRRETLANANINHPDLGDQKATFVEMTRKKHRSNSSSCNLDWTTKIYALLTSGYLLQYSGEGTPDRLPEKVVHLCKDSAAFASDVIPGRHWVLQVTSIFDESALPSQDNSRSLFGKLAMREKEKRQASDMLMVFESAADMENWMTLLRREIESLGGKRSLTETGAPKEAEDDLDQPCPRTLVVRDACRFPPSALSPEMRWDSLAAVDESELPPDADHTFDDDSTRNSFMSQDGHQLEGLRDSSNRFSFMSAARTVLTVDSSPANSPMRDSFGSQITDPDDATPMANDKPMVEVQVRRRPNAAEIDDRRRSYRTSNIFLDTSTNATPQPNHRGHASLSSIQDPPNFSLPHPGARRRTVTSGEPVHIAYTATQTTTVRPPRRARHPPPSSLGLSRPLSIVADSPSPIKSPLETNSSGNLRQLPDPEFDMLRASGQSSTGLQVPMTRPRKYASTTSLRPRGDSLCNEPAQMDLPVRAVVREPSPSGRAPGLVVEVSRSTPPMDTSRPASRSRSPILRAAAQRRGSLYSLQGSKAEPRQRSVSAFANGSTHRPTRSDYHDEAIGTRVRSPNPPRAPRRNTVVTTPSHHGHESGSDDQSLFDTLGSLPQLPQARAHTSLPVPPAGPPPMPPPNKALPPLPPIHKRRSESNPPRMRMRSVSALGGQI